MNEYKSPIEIAIETIHKEVNAKAENAILQAVQNVGINVDKNELIKALKYDRDQYDIGFNAGHNKGSKETAREILHTLKGLIREPFQAYELTIDDLVRLAEEYGIEVDNG